MTAGRSQPAARHVAPHTPPHASSRPGLPLAKSRRSQGRRQPTPQQRTEVRTGHSVQLKRGAETAWPQTRASEPGVPQQPQGPGSGSQPHSEPLPGGGPVSPHHPPPAPPGSATASLPVTRPFLLQHQRGSNLQPKSERYRICHQKPSQVTPPPGRDSAAGCLCWLV